MLHRQISTRVTNNGLNFTAMADDTGIQNQLLYVVVGHGGNRSRIELVEGFAIVLTLFQNGDPRQPGLLAFKANHFK